MSERDYEAIIADYLPLLYRVAKTILINDQDCADAVQEAILRGWTKRGQLRDPKLIRPWLARITVNECRNLQRRAHRQRKAVEAAMDDLRARPRPGSAHTDLEAAMTELPEKYRLPLVLYYSEKCTVREIAHIMNIPEGRLRERMRTARKLLERSLNHEA